MEEKEFIITESQLEEIEYHLKNHSIRSARAILKQLPLLKEENNEKKI